MKKIAFTISLASLVLSAVIYFSRIYQYEQYMLKVNSDKVYSYKININLANHREFENLPGIGPKLAGEIIKYRDEQGRFNGIEDIKAVKGIGEGKFNKIKTYLTLEV